MRLLNTETLALEEFADGDVPRYAILSHTWGDGEVTLRDMQENCAAGKRGHAKIEACCSIAKGRGFEYVWVDTCCIDKTSSAELSEAINSMYRWYQDAESCLAYLADVPSPVQLSDSRWFTRGWTLQELIAPSTVIFFDKDWKELGTKESLQEAVSNRTRIPRDLLSGKADIDDFSVAQKMSWAAKRQTTRVEDRAYSLLGIFGINMPLIYGEKETAFIRIQEEIMKISDDHSIFAWRSGDTRGGLLATSPDPFIDSRNIVDFIPPGALGSPLSVSGRGIHLELRFVGIDSRGIGLGILRCREIGAGDDPIAIYLRDPFLTMTQFERVWSEEFRHINMTKLRLSQCPLRKMCIHKGRMVRGEKPGDRGNDEHVALGIPSAEAYRTDSLLEAVENGRVGDIWLLLTRSDFEESLKGELGRRVLSRAVERCHEPVINLLLARSEIDADEKDKDGRTPLSKAAEAGRAAVVRRMLGSGKVEVESEDKDGRTPLSWATARGHLDVMDLLIEQGASIESNDRSHRTPLSYAAESGNGAVVQLLLGKGADVESEDGSGRFPLDYAESEAAARLLLDKHLLLASTSEHSLDAVLGPWPGALKAAIDLVLNGKVNHEMKGIKGVSLLSWASGNGLTTVARLLLQKGANINTKDRLQRTPLIWAASSGRRAIVKLLLERSEEFGVKEKTRSRLLSGAVAKRFFSEQTIDLETREASGHTALSKAAGHGHEAVVRLLLEKGANVEAEDKDGWTPLLWAARNGHEAVVRLLLEKGANIEARDNKYGQTPLLWAARIGREAVVSLLLEKGANVEAGDNTYGQTPLSWAAENGREVVVRLLLEKGANIEARDNTYGQTPLSWAARIGREAVVRLLLEKGANIEARDNTYGQTPLSWAARNGREAVVRLLLEKGANVEAEDKNGRTPLSLAARNGHKAVVRLLRTL